MQVSDIRADERPEKLVPARKPTVVYWGPQPSPYVVDRFNAVVDAGELELEAWFDVERESDRSWDVDPSTWRFPARILNAAPLKGRSRVPLKELVEVGPDLLILNSDRPHTAAGAVIGRYVARRVAFRSLPSFDAWTRRTWYGELAKHGLHRLVDGAKVPGPMGRDQVGRYGLPADRTWRVTQAINVPLFQTALETTPAGRAQLRGSLGIPTDACLFVYVGRLWEGKGVSYLLDAYRRVRLENPGVALILIGEGPQEEEYRASVAGVAGVHFVGHVQPTDLPAWYGASDVLVFPTLGDPNGLVVEEAMTAGLPVISTSSAGDIYLRVREGHNGLVVPPADSDALAVAMLRTAGDAALRASMSDAARTRAAEVDTKAYAADFGVFVREILSAPRRNGAMARLAHATGHLTVLAHRRMESFHHRR